MIDLPSRFEGQQLRRAKLHRHVRKFEAHALKLTNRLSELNTIHCPLRSKLKRPLRPSQTGGCDLQPCGAKPGICNLESLVYFTQDRGSWHAAIVEFQNAVVISTM